MVKQLGTILAGLSHFQAMDRPLPLVQKTMMAMEVILAKPASSNGTTQPRPGSNLEVILMVKQLTTILAGLSHFQAMAKPLPLVHITMMAMEAILATPASSNGTTQPRPGSNLELILMVKQLTTILA